MTDRIAIVGASGFAREVRDICWDLGARNICFLGLNSDPEELDGFPVFRDEPEAVSALVDGGYRLAIGVGNPAVRAKICEAHASYPFATLIHPSATFGWKQRESVERTTGAILAAGVRLMSNIRLGAHTVLSLNVTVGHDAVLDDFCAVMPGASIAGNVILERGVFVGAGAVTLQGTPDRPLVIGAGAQIGAGAVVVRDVPSGATVIGVPGRATVRETK